MTAPASLGLVVRGTGALAHAWQDSTAPGREAIGFSYYAGLAQTAEAAGFDFICIADRAALPDRDSDTLARTDRGVAFDALTVASALAAVTERIGLLAGANTNYDEPYSLARRFESLDHISGGRGGWYLTVGAGNWEARQFNRAEPAASDERYERATEFAEIVHGLWDSWDDDAFLLDRDAGRFFDPAKLHPLNHTGRHFQVRGPLCLARSVQGQPVVLHDAASDAGRELAAAHADIVHGIPADETEAKRFVADLRARLARHGRAAELLKLMPAICPIVGATEAAAKDKAKRLLAHGDTIEDPAIWLLTGTPATIADALEARVEAGLAHGFCVMPALLPAGLDDFVSLVLPELRRRALVANEPAGPTLRDRLGLPRPILLSTARPLSTTAAP
jgi:FMN-dependent oxidoreductase (nitrilotriacetate monooxygenase family)